MEPAFATADFTITSPAFRDMEPIPARFTCDGEDVSPALAIANVPAGAASLVIFCEDPDSPSGTWDHWVRFNISPDTREIPEGSYPGDGSGKTTGSSLGWQGPCPHEGEHRYVFRAYALDARLDLPDGVTKAEVERAMDGHILARAALVGIYRRQGPSRSS
jgi:Raf kinase inhibitor-like YbhB/YbcL family protein